MALYDAREKAWEGWSGYADECDPSSPQSGVRLVAPQDGEDVEIRARSGWLSRLVDAGARVLQGARRDPEPRALLEAAELLERDGGVVFADLDGWPRPPVIQGFVPDLYAVFEDREIVLSFVNEQSVLRDAAVRRDRAHSSWAQASTLRIYEQVMVEGGRGGRGISGAR